jgi:LexA-binding, inner membrane-associated putative hydrolase
VLPFAHAGITLGAAVLLNGLFGSHAEKTTQQRNDCVSATGARLQRVEAWVTSAGYRIDLRVLLTGSLLPDLDKLTGRLVFGTFGGRLFCHSLLFLLIIATAGLCLYLIRRKNRLLVLGLGVLMHLVLDGMWFDLQTLLWPSLGFSFPTIERTGWLQGVFHRLFTSPSIYMPEALGVVMLACFAWLLVQRGKVRAFILHGRV